MESADLLNLIELLDDNVDDLEDALAPLLGNALSDVASKMPLMDRAQLYVLVTYAIESVLFCMLVRHNFDCICAKTSQLTCDSVASTQRSIPSFGN